MNFAKLTHKKGSNLKSKSGTCDQASGLVAGPSVSMLGRALHRAPASRLRTNVSSRRVGLRDSVQSPGHALRVTPASELRAFTSCVGSACHSQRSIRGPPALSLHLCTGRHALRVKCVR